MTNKKWQQALLLHYAGEEVNDIVQTLPDTIAGPYEDPLKKTIMALRNHFTPKTNVACKFTNADQEIKSQIIQLCSSTKLRRKSLHDPGKTLHALLDLLWRCSFCVIYKEDLYHLSYDCSYARAFWNRFCNWWSNFQSENLSLSLRNVIVSFLNRNDLLNYLIILGKLCVWEYRRNKSIPKFKLFLHKVEVKKESERLIVLRNKKLQDFRKRWEPLL